MRQQINTSCVTHFANTKESPLVRVEKIIAAPRAKVFAAWANQDQVRRWWGPAGFECPNAQLDFRVGGKYLFEMLGVDGSKDIWSGGEFLEIIPNQKIVCTDYPSNAQGEVMPAGTVEGPFADLGEAFITIELHSESANRTKLVLSHEGLPARIHHECVQGWLSSLSKLEKFVVKN